MLKHDSKAKTYTLYSKDGSKRLANTNVVTVLAFG